MVDLWVFGESRVFTTCSASGWGLPLSDIARGCKEAEMPYWLDESGGTSTVSRWTLGSANVTKKNGSSISRQLILQEREKSRSRRAMAEAVAKDTNFVLREKIWNELQRLVVVTCGQSWISKENLQLKAQKIEQTKASGLSHFVFVRLQSHIARCDTVQRRTRKRA